ncbi:expressed protein [Dictyostelium purpureum]|uniref:Expressed protein n=1 Tax=Dictyostelium purpureum TaxID=5786 RepID=F0ZQJ2_DICPU|nr:uncharacterized protein DICPUDRAFT_98460 [Dictyostelium purpureum]EGC33761.1 expressed protein [Dictyostelium purpureum]|eukprot:XP_003289686.1 expressed protein [Dictyostelium purpureum]
MRVFLTLVLVLALISCAFGQNLFQVSGDKCGSNAPDNTIRLDDCHGMCDSRFKIVARNNATYGGFIFTEYDNSNCNSDRATYSVEFVCPKTLNTTARKYAIAGKYNVFCFIDQTASVQPTETPQGNSATTVALSAGAVLASLVAVFAAL